MKKIVVKEIDKYTSKLCCNKTISEFLIYLMVDDIKAHAYIEIGEEAKKQRINELILTHFMTDNNTLIDKEEIIEEISLEKILSK